MTDSFKTTIIALIVAVAAVVLLFRMLDAIFDLPARYVARKLSNWTSRGGPQWDGRITFVNPTTINGHTFIPGTYRFSGSIRIEGQSVENDQSIIIGLGESQ